ncbi:MAG: hypothetical protein ABIG71_02345, partial [Candidatus Uhrbacteria bacterium]
EFSCGHFVRGEDGKFYDVEPPKRWVCIAELLRGRRSDDSDACAVLMVRGEHWHGSRVQIKCIPPSLFEEFGGLPSP